MIKQHSDRALTWPGAGDCHPLHMFKVLIRHRSNHRVQAILIERKHARAHMGGYNESDIASVLVKLGHTHHQEEEPTGYSSKPKPGSPNRLFSFDIHTASQRPIYCILNSVKLRTYAVPDKAICREG